MNSRKWIAVILVTWILMFSSAGNAATMISGTDPATLATFPDRTFVDVDLPWVDVWPPGKWRRFLVYQQTDPTLRPILLVKFKKRTVRVSEAP